MEAIVTYRKRKIGAAQLDEIRGLLAARPNLSRRALSQELCRMWSWRQPNGMLKDMVCRGLLLELERRGLIRLPPRKRTPPNPLGRRPAPRKIEVDQTPLAATLDDLGALKLRQVRRTPEEAVFNSLLAEHHYLGCPRLVGEHLKYVAYAGERPIALVGWASALWYVGARDRFIGWSNEQRKAHLHLVADNVRFLILPWVRVPNLASRILALNRACLSRDWLSLYGHPIHLVQTFVDPNRFRGSCYKADNWQYVGDTTGRGKLNPTQAQRFTKKCVYVHPLTVQFRRLCCGPSSL